MTMTAVEIETMIKDYFSDAVVVIQDLAGDGDHYQASIISTAFKGKSRVEQHKMVYAALKGKMGQELHALSLKTQSPL